MTIKLWRIRCCCWYSIARDVSDDEARRWGKGRKKAKFKNNGREITLPTLLLRRCSLFLTLSLMSAAAATAR